MHFAPDEPAVLQVLNSHVLEQALSIVQVGTLLPCSVSSHCGAARRMLPRRSQWQ